MYFTISAYVKGLGYLDRSFIISSLVLFTVIDSLNIDIDKKVKYRLDQSKLKAVLAICGIKVKAPMLYNWYLEKIEEEDDAYEY